MLYVEAEGKILNSGELTRLDRALYIRAHKRFGSWDAFIREVTMLLLPGWRRDPWKGRALRRAAIAEEARESTHDSMGKVNVVKQQECVEDYIAYVDTEGKALNSGDIMRIDPALYKRIQRRFGSWRAFFTEIKHKTKIIEGD